MGPASDLVLLSSKELPEPHPEDLLIMRDLAEEGISASLENWEDFDPISARTQGILFRTTWGYYREPSKFRKFLKRVNQSRIPVWNSPYLIRWNLNKKYLIELRKKSCPVIPTKVFEPGTLDFAAACNALESESLVLKPAIGASASNTFRVELGESASTVTSYLEEHKNSCMLAQPFFEQIQTEGEYSLIFIDGVFTHGVLKSPKDGDFRVQEEFGGGTRSVSIPSKAVRTAQSILDQLDEETLYARVDLIRSSSGQFLLMELELIEPQLFFQWNEAASKKLAYSISKRI